jgi:hypothetical protein
MDTRAATWVSTVGVDERAQIVVVSLNRRDPDYADRLIAEFGAGNVHVEPDPTVVTLVPPAPAQMPDARRETRQPGS